MVGRAPQARQMVARGEREARSPRNVREKKYRPGRPTETGQRVCRHSGAGRFLSVIQGQRSRCARTFPRLTTTPPAARTAPRPKSAPGARGAPGPKNPPGGLWGGVSDAPPGCLMFAWGLGARRHHAAPGSQIKSARAPQGRQSRWPVSVGLPGLYFFSQTFQGLRASRSPLATFCRACGALTTMFPTRTLMFPDQDSCSRPGLMT
jgi:hypothetical protein